MGQGLFCTNNQKAEKAADYGYLNAILYLAPADLSGWNLCPHASEGCKAACLGWTSGQAGMVSVDTQINSVRASRIAKAKRFMRDRAAFMADVVSDIEKLVRKADRQGDKLCVRMNGSADIAWEGVKCVRNGVEYRNVFEAFSDVQFVDYTKNPRRFDRALPANYHLTFSRSESNDAFVTQVLSKGGNVAVVFDKARKAQVMGDGAWHGYAVTDGDLHDLRHLDPKGPRGCVVALTPKGRKAARDTSGFVLH